MNGGWIPGHKPETWDFVSADVVHARVWKRFNAATGETKFDTALMNVVGHIRSCDSLAEAKSEAESALFRHATIMKGLLT